MTERRDDSPRRIDPSMLATPGAVVPVAARPATAEGPQRRDFERGMSALPTLTLLLILANVLAFVHQVDAHGLHSEKAIVDAGALARNAVVIDGEIWRIWAAGFLHGGFDHLLGNMVTLYIVGMALEHAVGLLATLRVYALAMTLASIASLVTDPGPSLGASGAIFGLVGALLVVLHRHRHVLAMRDSRILAVLGVWAAIMLGAGLANPHIDNAAHMGGLITGALVGLTLKLRLDVPPASSTGRPRVR